MSQNEKSTFNNSENIIKYVLGNLVDIVSEDE